MTRRASDKTEEQAQPAQPDPKQYAGPDNEYIRVAHPTTGDHYTTTRALARIAGARPLPDHDATDRYGQPLPRKTKENIR